MIIKEIAIFFDNVRNFPYNSFLKKRRKDIHFAKKRKDRTQNFEVQPFNNIADL